MQARCSGTMTEAQYLAWIRSALRSKWLRWPPRAEALKAAQVPYSGPNTRRKYSYLCAICGKLFAQKDVEVDHFPHDAGSILSVDDIGNFCNNLYCEIDNLRVVCKECHGIHTLATKQGLTFMEAVATKKAILKEKLGTKKVVDFLKGHGYVAGQLKTKEGRRKCLVEVFVNH